MHCSRAKFGAFLQRSRVTFIKARRNKWPTSPLLSFKMSSSAPPSNVPRDPRIVPVLANLGPFFGSEMPVPFWNVPQNLKFQPMDVGKPVRFYQLPTLYFSPSLVSSREATPLSTTSTTPDYALHPHAVNNVAVPTMNQVCATQQLASLASVEAANGQSAPPHNNTGGPIRGSNRSKGKRPTPYTRSFASSPFFPSSTQASECLLPSSIAQARLAVQGVCKINSCGDTFTSTSQFKDHVVGEHKISRGKQGPKLIKCLWEGCGETKTEGSLFNHVMGHHTKSACSRCHRDTKGMRADSVWRHIEICPRKADPLEDNHPEAYSFFYEEEP
ncbi:hypothetical protein BYT27DRAFT_7255104 [Phlegmacium glaucopus]|nr:hypothetical protein BYT27DRAFT_7255104 [Phlegmacium glaucopus]